MAESNPNSFNCSAKKDIANKPFKIGDPTNYFEDPVVCSGFIDVQGIPSRPTDIEITNGDVRIYTGKFISQARNFYIPRSTGRERTLCM